MRNQAVIIELDNEEAKSIIKFFDAMKLEKFLQELLGNEEAKAAREEIQNILLKIRY